MGKRLILILAYSALALGMLAFCYVHWTWFLLTFFLLLFCPGLGGTLVVRGSIVREYFGRGAFGKLIGIIQGAGSVGAIIGPTLAGWTFDRLGSYYPIWISYAALAALSVWMAMGVRPPAKSLYSDFSSSPG